LWFASIAIVLIVDVPVDLASREPPNGTENAFFSMTAIIVSAGGALIPFAAGSSNGHRANARSKDNKAPTAMKGRGNGMIVREMMAAAVVLVAILGIVLGPSTVVCSATEWSGTSDPIPVGTWWRIDLATLTKGDILLWSWSTYDTLTFRVSLPDGSYQYALSDYDGIVIENTGVYKLEWYNNNWFFEAYVDYWVAAFAPILTVTTPTEGQYFNSPTISVQGYADAYADGVLVGPDALHLREADWSVNDWGVDGVVLNEGQQTILVRSYYLLDWDGYKNHTVDRYVHVTVDTVQPDLAITSPADESFLTSSVDVSWQCSDESGVAQMEVRVDLLGWQAASETSQHFELADGTHTIAVRITDLAGNKIVRNTTFLCDTAVPQVTATTPEMNAKISENDVLLSWSGSDALSGIDHYEVSVDGGAWVDVGSATSHQLDNLDDKWHSVTVKAVDRSGNTAESSVSFGIYTSIWSTNGPYQGIPLFGLIAAIVVGAILFIILYRRKRGATPTPSPQEPPSETQ